MYHLQNVDINLTVEGGAGGRPLPRPRYFPVYRDWTQIPIPGFLKIKYRYFSGFLYSTQDNVFKYVYWFLANLRVFGDSQNL